MSMNIALTGLRALDKKLDVTADNVANVNTDNFKRSRAESSETCPAGVEVSIYTVDTPGMILPAEGSAPERESSNVNIAEELVDLITTEHYYTANLEVIRAEEETAQALIDIIA